MHETLALPPDLYPEEEVRILASEGEEDIRWRLCSSRFLAFSLVGISESVGAGEGVARISATISSGVACIIESIDAGAASARFTALMLGVD
jgi:hypothetical protein